MNIKVENTRVIICGDCCRDKSAEEVKDILKRVAKNVRETFSDT